MTRMTATNGTVTGPNEDLAARWPAPQPVSGIPAQAPPPAAYAPMHRPRGWWGRNWKWVLVVSIIASLLAVGAMVMLMIALLFGAGADGCTMYTDEMWDGVTNPPPVDGNTLEAQHADDDGGHLRLRASDYYRGGPIPLALQ